jgi:hypothetical protein
MNHFCQVERQERLRAALTEKNAFMTISSSQCLLCAQGQLPGIRQHSFSAASEGALRFCTGKEEGVVDRLQMVADICSPGSPMAYLRDHDW